MLNETCISLAVMKLYKCSYCCKTVYFRCILISRFWIVEISLHFNLAFSQCSTSIYQALMGKLNFCGYLISRFYPTREIRENLMHAKNTCFTVLLFTTSALLFAC